MVTLVELETKERSAVVPSSLVPYLGRLEDKANRCEVDSELLELIADFKEDMGRVGGASLDTPKGDYLYSVEVFWSEQLGKFQRCMKKGI